jgi:hypothetical protein
MRFNISVTLAALTLLSACSRQNSDPIPPAHDFVRAMGNQLVVGETSRPVLLRGVALFPSESPTENQMRFQELAELGVNTIRIPFGYRDFFEPEAPDSAKPDAWDAIDEHIALARQHGMWVILHDLDIEGWQPVPIIGQTFDYSIWSDPELQERYIGLWRMIAERYSNEPQVAGFSLFFEPITAGGREQWRDLAQRTVDAIRAVDPNHTIFIERIYGENADRREVSGIDLSPDDAFVTVEDDNLVYEFYFFERDEYTHQFASWREDTQIERVYPDPDWTIDYQETSGFKTSLPFDRSYLEFYLARQLEFGESHDVPMSIWGFGAMQTCFVDDRGGLRWLTDVLDLVNDSEVHWTLWGYFDEHFLGENHEDARPLLHAALTAAEVDAE